MLKQFLLTGLFLILCICAVAQVHKRFYKNGKITKDSTKATSYVLFKQEGEDSLWSVVELNMHHVPFYKGTYLDTDFTIPHGKFVYYQNVLEQMKIDEHHSSIDTMLRIKSVQFFNNGKQEGMRVDYYPNGKKKSLATYEDGLLNGLYEDYDEQGRIFSRSNYINNLREGDSYTFWADSSVRTHSEFFHNSQIYYKDFSEDDKSFSAYPGFNFEYYVLKYLKKLGLPAVTGMVIVAFTVDADGKLINPKITIGINPIIDEAIMEALKNSPRWTPATIKHKKVEQKIGLAFQYKNLDN